MAYIVDHTIIEIARIEKSGTQGSTFKANKPDQDRLTIELQILGGSRLVVVDLQKVTQNNSVHHLLFWLNRSGFQIQMFL